VSVRALQIALAAVFIGLGGWCLVAPGSVLVLCFRPEVRVEATIVSLLVSCFGAQAILAGLFAAFSRFTAATFLAFGVALLPFFVFDWWFYAVKPTLTPLGAGADAAGNLVMLAVCVLGWRAAGREFRRV
jgi:hypothetical protein